MLDNCCNGILKAKLQEDPNILYRKLQRIPRIWTVLGTHKSLEDDKH